MFHEWVFNYFYKNNFYNYVYAINLRLEQAFNLVFNNILSIAK